MSNLAIKGHPTRGNEVIELLEMLGGSNIHNCSGTFNECYAIDNNKICTIYTSVAKIDNHTIFTLEEFLEKYPYKVGDTVACYVGIILEKEYHTIVRMQWDSDKCRILYYLDNCNVIEVEDILYSIEYKTEQSKWEKIKNIDNLTITNEEDERNMIKIPEFQQSINLSQLNLDEIEVVLGDYEFVLKDSKTYFIKKKPNYPKTYAESCSVLGFNKNYDLNNITTHDVVYDYKLQMLYRLLICLDAYWKIAGEELGLGKPWKPEWSTESEIKYVIEVYKDNIRKNSQYYTNTTLSFPTPEMRNAFYENFKDLIENCKELL